MAHTPGPWTVLEKDCIVAGNGNHVVCGGHDYGDGGIIGEPDDARLIAAAPDLLEAAKHAVMEWRPHGQLTDSCRVLEAAIAKAEGR